MARFYPLSYISSRELQPHAIPESGSQETAVEKVLGTNQLCSKIGKINLLEFSYRKLSQAFVLFYSLEATEQKG